MPVVLYSTRGHCLYRDSLDYSYAAIEIPSPTGAGSPTVPTAST